MKEIQSYRYRLKWRWVLRFEPQMQFTAGATGQTFWTPLLITGYWAEPDSYSFGIVKGRHPLTFKEARLAIRRAKLINSSGYLRPTILRASEEV